MAAITLHFKISWWVRVYINTIAAICWLTNMEPDMDRVAFWVGKGIKLTATPVTDGIGGA